MPENEFLKEIISTKRDLSELTENTIYCIPVNKKKKGQFYSGCVGGDSTLFL